MKINVVSCVTTFRLQPSGTEFLKSRGPLVLSVPLGMRDEEAKLRKEEAVRAVAEAAAIVKDEAKAEVEELRRRLKAARKMVADSLGIVSFAFRIWCGLSTGHCELCSHDLVWRFSNGHSRQWQGGGLGMIQSEV